MKTIATILSSFAVALNIAAASPVRDTRLRQIYSEHLREISHQLNTLEIDIAGIDHAASLIGVVVTPDQERLLEDIGFDLIPDMSALSENGPDEDYHSPDEVSAELHAFASQYPDLAQVWAFGKSVQGQDLLVVRISNDAVASNRPKPSILINAMHHAREVMTTEVAIDAVQHLLSQYGQDPRVTRWVDESQIYIVPMLNVDGNQKVWTDAPMWRKNVRGDYGVDINRNYPFLWNGCTGSSGNRNSERYRGPSPASEPETQALMQLVEQIHPLLNLSLHAYGELVIYPYGCEGEALSSPPLLAEIGQQIAQNLPRDSGSGTYRAGTPFEVLYPVDGDDLSWMLHEQGVLPYVIEVNRSQLGFQPAFHPWRQLTVEKLRAAWGTLLDRLTGPAIDGAVRAANGLPVPKAVIELRSSGSPESRPLFKFKSRVDGTFHILVAPGRYEIALQGSAPGRPSRPVDIESSPVSLELIQD